MVPYNLSLEDARRIPKILLHEHLDCSVRPARLLELQSRRSRKSGVWLSGFVDSWDAARSSRSKDAAARRYGTWLRQYAKGSLPNYLDAIVRHVLPAMQDQDSLYQITKDRIEDAIEDGVVAMQLRLAPQLHLREGLSTQEVLEPIMMAIREYPIPVRLTLCSLRHENGRTARHLADAVLRNDLITGFDLAGDETAFPGVPKWWLKQARRIKEGSDRKSITCHLGETVPITDQDHIDLDSVGCTELGHGFRGDCRDKTATICVSSNIQTGQFAVFRQHPVNAMLAAGKKITIDTDGTLFTGTTASQEYQLLAKNFGWGLAEFEYVYGNALEKFRVNFHEHFDLSRLRSSISKAHD